MSLLLHAGPVLLNLLVSYLTTGDEARLLGSGSAAKGASLEGRHAGWQDYKGYVYALLLGLSALLKVAIAHALPLAVLCLPFPSQKSLEVNTCARISLCLLMCLGCVEPSARNPFAGSVALHLAVACLHVYWRQSVLPCQWQQHHAADMQMQERRSLKP